VGGVAFAVRGSSTALRRVQSGSIGLYVLLMVLSITLIVALRFFTLPFTGGK
jgi:hypothetical protein